MKLTAPRVAYLLLLIAVVYGLIILLDITPIDNPLTFSGPVVQSPFTSSAMAN